MGYDPHQVESVRPGSLADEVENYLSAVIDALTDPIHPRPTELGDPEELSEAVFKLLTAREYCYLSRGRTEPYRERSLSLIRRHIERHEPVRLYFDIGPGYKASTHPGETGLWFDVGLAEVFFLHQTISFCRRLSEFYAPGARFALVVDNLCGLMTNDIPLEQSEAYVARLRDMIDETGVGEWVEVLVESEEFTVEQYEHRSAELAREDKALAPREEDIDNVSRFLGRECSESEATERILRYVHTGQVTESLLQPIINGVRMTQRASSETLCFRPFPGGDSRTQCGEVALTVNAKGRIRPVLLTTRNIDGFRCQQFVFPDLLPSGVRHVTFAEPVGD